MGRIRILSDQVANQIAAGEVVDRPASVVKELIENSIDAGANKIRIEVEGGGRKLIRIADDGCGMMRDDAMLAFERHATSKIRSSDDLLSLATLGFRGEALPSIASISRLELETRTPQDTIGTRVEIVGGRVMGVEDSGTPPGTILAVRDLFFNTPARRKFMRAESTELSHVTSLVTHYALAHPGKHFELHSATQPLIVAPPVSQLSERIYQIFGRDLLGELIPVAAERTLERTGLPEPPPWQRGADYTPPQPGQLRLSGYTSKPALQKLNRNSIYVFINQRLVRDRLILHAVNEAYRNIIPPTSYPVLLLYLEMPPEEVDVNVHPAKTEVRFRQQSFIHDFVRESLRNALIHARPAAGFQHALHNAPTAASSFMPGLSSGAEPEEIWAPQPGESEGALPPLEQDYERFSLAAPLPSPQEQPLPFAEAALAAQSAPDACSSNIPAEFLDPDQPEGTLNSVGSLKPIGQLRESFILATNEEGLWIIDQHVAHERVLFEKILRERQVERVQRQRLLMPLLVDLEPRYMVVFAEIARELEANGFEVEPFGPRTLAVKAAPVGLEGRELERVLIEVMEQTGRESQSTNLDALRTRIAASIACHSAIKVNMPLDTSRMEWLLAELGRTEHPTSCPHGRPIALRYAWKEILRAFQRV